MPTGEGGSIEGADEAGAETSVTAVGETLREHGLSAPAPGGGMTFLQAKTANEVLKAQERRLRLAKLKGELVERDRAVTLVFRLARRRELGRRDGPGRLRGLNLSDLRLGTIDYAAVGNPGEGTALRFLWHPRDRADRPSSRRRDMAAEPDVLLEVSRSGWADAG